MFHELASFGGRDSPLYAFTKPGVLLEKSQDSILYQSLCVGSRMAGHSGEQRFLLGGKIYFHTRQSRRA